MGETAASGAALEVSVSFGRYENDSLSWEKWSTFSPNKYLEEVGKCATPGSVAEKKAYFEAHYKKIAARKAELMEQDKQVQSVLFRPDTEQDQGDVVKDVAKVDYKVDAPVEQNFAIGIEQVHYDGAMEQDIEPNEEDLITIECHSFSVEPERVQEEPHKGEDELLLDIMAEEHIKMSVNEQEVSPTTPAAVCAKSRSQLQNDVTQCQKNAAIGPRSNVVPQEEKSPSNQTRITQKNAKSSREKDTPKMRNKSSSPLLKSPQFTTPKVSKPAPATTTKSASRLSTKAKTAQSTPRANNPNPPASDNTKKVAPKSLHMSVSPKPASTPASAPALSRKSFIMDSMGDKDIVRRAFKMFQNSSIAKLNLSGDEKSPMSKQAPARRTEVRASQSFVTPKENGGTRTQAPLQRGPKAAPTSVGVRSNERTREVPQHAKKLQDKPNAKVQEQVYLQSKSKADKGAVIKTLRHCRNVKAEPARASDRLSKVKGKPDQGEIHR